MIWGELATLSEKFLSRETGRTTRYGVSLVIAMGGTTLNGNKTDCQPMMSFGEHIKFRSPGRRQRKYAGLAEWVYANMMYDARGQEDGLFP